MYYQVFVYYADTFPGISEVNPWLIPNHVQVSILFAQLYITGSHASLITFMSSKAWPYRLDVYCIHVCMKMNRSLGDGQKSTQLVSNLNGVSRIHHIWFH